MDLVTSNFLAFTTARDEIADTSRGDQDESREEERVDYESDYSAEHLDVSVFSTLTDLLFNPFLDGYCKTPFCSDADYMPPMCPSAAFYSSSPEETHNRVPHQTPPKAPGGQIVDDEYAEICQSGSGASSGVSSRRRRCRPLALAVGYGDELKDQKGRRVVITPRACRSQSTVSPYRQRRATDACTCDSRVPKSPRSRDCRPNSPHESKVVMCTFCTTRRMREEGLLPRSTSVEPGQ